MGNVIAKKANRPLIMHGRNLMVMFHINDVRNTDPRCVCGDYFNSVRMMRGHYRQHRSNVL